MIERAQQAVAESRARILEDWRRRRFLGIEAIELAQWTRDMQRWCDQLGVERP